MTAHAKSRSSSWGRYILALLAILLVTGTFVAFRRWRHQQLDIALIAAVQAGQAEMVRDLLVQGANPTTRLPERYTGYVITSEMGEAASAPRSEDITVLTLAIRQAFFFQEYTPLSMTSPPLVRHSYAESYAVVKLLLPQHPPQDRRLLTLAARAEDLDLLRHLLQAGLREAREQPALEWAIRHDNVEMVKLLLDNGDNAKAPTTNGAMPLTLAITPQGAHSLALVRLLLDQGADVNATTIGGTALNSAAWSGRDDIVRLLLERGAAVNQLSYGSSALMAAARSGHNAVVRLLLEHGAKVNMVDSQDSSALMLAARHDTTVRLLLDHGAEPNIVVNDDPLSISVAIPGMPAHTPTLLSQPGRFQSAISAKGSCILAYVARDGKPDLVRLLLAHGAKVNARSKDGYTALHWLAQNGTPTALKLLLDNGADVHARTRYGVTPLHIAARQGNTAGVALLLDRGAVVNAQDTLGTTPLMLAASAPLAKDEAVKLLLARGAAVEAQDKAGDTALHLAVYNGHIDSVQMLLARGAQVDARNRAGETPLMLAVASHTGRKTVVPLLLQKGADVNARDRLGQTVLTIARRQKRALYLPLLTEAGARE